jgi:hypothetical protein
MDLFYFSSESLISAFSAEQDNADPSLFCGFEAVEKSAFFASVCSGFMIFCLSRM